MMSYFYPLLLYVGLVGGLLLLGITSFTRSRPLHKPVAAIWLTVLLCVWLLLPQASREVFSIWSPAAMLGGQILLDMNPTVWGISLVLIVIACAATWVEFSEHRATAPLSGPLLIASLLMVTAALASGSLLTTLGTWAVFDLLWAAVALIAGAQGEQVTFGLATHGVSSVILWLVSLLLLREGGSGLWWLMWPAPPLFTLLVVAALMRIGFYPFHIVFPRALGPTRSLGLAYLMGPLLGIGLLYRLMILPGATGALPGWVIGWGIFSLFWNALMAWAGQRQRLALRAGHALLLVVVTTASVLGTASLLLWGTAVWFAGVMLLALSRSYAAHARRWIWPRWVAVLFLLGVPPSPLGPLMWGLLENVTWGWRWLLLASMSLIGGVLLQQNAQRTAATPVPPRAWQRVFFIVGQMLIVGILLLTTLESRFFLENRDSNAANVDLAASAAFPWLGWTLWCVAIAGAVGAARWRAGLQLWSERLQPLLDFLDLQWFYRSMWRGAENLLGFLRVAAEVIEGSGAMLWSLLILLLVLLVVTNQ